MSIASEHRTLRLCTCGCGQSFPLFGGLHTYAPGRVVAFRAAHLEHGDSGPHVWLLIGSGPWFEDDARGCWVVLHVWIADAQLLTRIEDPEGSPFNEGDVFDERLLKRAEVLAKEGASAWAVARREQLVAEHPPTADFLLRSAKSAPDDSSPG